MAEEHNLEVNVEQIMEEIRERIRREEKMEEIPAFESIPIKEEVPAVEQNTQSDLSKIEGSLQYINANYDIPYYWSFGPAGVKTFVKRVVRKLAKCLIPPILEKQNHFNAHVVNCLNEMKALFTRMDTQEAEIDILKKRLSEQLATTDELRSMILHNKASVNELQLTVSANIEDLRGGIARNEETVNSLQSIATGIGELRSMIMSNEETVNALQSIAASVDELRSMIMRNEESVNTLQLKAAGIDELYSASVYNENAINELKSDMECIRRVDASIFNDRDKNSFEKYGQAGEDSIVSYIFGKLGYKPSEVSYLDIGANHARDLSNTYYFYQQGAGGVLVEADPNLIPELRLLRQRDVILNRCISSVDGEYVDFYILSNDGLSTKSRKSVDHTLAVDGEVQVDETVRIKTISVKQILEEYFAQTPMLLNIDVEGSEMEVLTSWDFQKYRPTVIIAETIPYETNFVFDRKNQEIISYLGEKGYVEYAFTGINSIFIDTERVGDRSSDNSCANNADYLQSMLMNELGSRNSYGICLRPGGIAYGPYIVCAVGEYQLEVKVVLLDRSSPTYLNITVEMGTVQIGQFELKNGTSNIRFCLKDDAEKVEFVLENRTNDNIYLAAVNLHRER